MTAKPRADRAPWASGNAFLQSVENACSRVTRDMLAGLISELAPPARTWCIELDAAKPSTADFCFAIGAEEAPPPRLRDARSFRLLESIIGEDAGDGRWFFEIDAASGSTSVHSFVRLRPSARPATSFVAHVRARAAPDILMLDAMARFVSTAPAPFEFSDVGIIVRDGAVQVRLGALPPARYFERFLERANTGEELGAAFTFLVPGLVRHDRCALQLSVPEDGPATCSGIEIGLPNESAGWRPLLTELAAHGWLDEGLARRALEWQGRERVATDSRGWPNVLTREISHVKLVVRDGAVRVKVYLVASERFALFI